jgi:glycosyltransferase involved in cell wall biosynthesis
VTLNPVGISRLSQLLNTLVSRPLRRILLRRWLRFEAERCGGGLTVVVPVQDRAGSRLHNLLRSLRAQRAASALHVVVVDYGSAARLAAEVSALAQEHGAHVLRVAGPLEWNRARALNLGLRWAKTAYVLFADADLVFRNDYAATAVEALHEDPRRLVVSRMLDLPEGHSVEIDQDNVEELRPLAQSRIADGAHPSIVAASREALELAGGYDEEFRLWGSEDDDLFRRLCNLGLEPHDISDRTLYLHQWHRKHEGVESVSLQGQIRANSERLRAKGNFAPLPVITGVVLLRTVRASLLEAWNRVARRSASSAGR